MRQVLNLAVTLSPQPLNHDETNLPDNECILTALENKMPQERMRQKTLGPIDSFLHSLNLQITVENLGLIWSGYLQLKLLKDYHKQLRHFTFLCKPSDKTKSK